MSYDLEYGKDERGLLWRVRPLAFLRENEPDYNDAEFLIKRWPKTFRLVPYVAHSRQYDYGGPTHESNYRTWKKDFADTEGKTWWSLDRQGILVRIDIAPSDQKEAIETIEDTATLDENDESELKQEIQDENWADYGLKDTRDELLTRADQSIYESVENLFEVMPDKVFANAYWEQVSNEGNGPEQDGGGYGTVFPRAFEDWDGESFHDLVMWLGLSDNVVRVRLSDSAFTPWRPTKKPGEKERTLRITKKDLEDTAGDKLTKSQLAQLIRDEEIQIKFNEEFPCESLYVECVYPWETEDEDEEPEAKENPIAAEKFVDPDFHMVLAPKLTPQWLIAGHSGQKADSADEPFIRVRIPEENEEFTDPDMLFQDWEDFKSRLVLPDAHYKRMYFAAPRQTYYNAKMLRRSVKWREKLKDDPLATGLGAIDIFYGDSPVWWVDLNEGPVQAATLFDLASVTQPASLSDGLVMMPGIAAGNLWLMSLDQWDSAEWPAESQGGPPYTPHVSVARENPKTPPKALANKAVAAMRVYLGSVGKVQYRDEQKLYERARKAVEKMAQGTGAGWNEWWPAVEDAARREGLRTAMPGKDI